jgi:hypothetical protein
MKEHAVTWKAWKNVKFSLCFSITKHHALKAYWASRGIAPRILDLGTRWRWVVSFTPPPLYPQGKSPWYPLDTRLGGPRTVLDAVVKRKIPSPRREWNPRTPILQPATQRYTDWAIEKAIETQPVKLLSGPRFEAETYRTTTDPKLKLDKKNEISLKTDTKESQIRFVLLRFQH